MANRMILNETSYHGKGAIAAIPTEFHARNFKKAVVITDKELHKIGVVAKVTTLLDEAEIAYEIYDGIVPNPTIENVKQGVAFVQAAKADVILAIGGGSPIDTAKAIGIIVTNPEFSDVRSLEARGRYKTSKLADLSCSDYFWNGG